MKQDDIPYYLIKIGKREHIESLRCQGEVYMNPIKYFRETEKTMQRKDEHDGASRVEQVDWIKLRFENNEIEYDRHFDVNRITKAQLWITNPKQTGNIYSMIAINPLLSSTTDRLDKRNMSDDDSFLIINKPLLFCRRLKQEIENKGYKSYFDSVKYYDENRDSRSLDPFSKTSKLDYENEFRVFVEHDKDEPLTFKIGSLIDISEIHPIEDFVKIRI